MKNTITFPEEKYLKLETVSKETINAIKIYDLDSEDDIRFIESRILFTLKMAFLDGYDAGVKTGAGLKTGAII